MIYNFTLSGRLRGVTRTEADALLEKLANDIADLLDHEAIGDGADLTIGDVTILKARQAKGTQKPRCAICDKEQARWIWLPHGLRPGNTFALPEQCLPIGYKCKGILDAGQPLAYMMDGHSYVANQPKEQEEYVHARPH